MSFQRLTTERALARHRFKRSRRAVDQASSSVLEVTSSLLLPNPNTLVTSLSISAFPPIGTGRIHTPSLGTTNLDLGTNTGTLQAVSTTGSSSPASPSLPSSTIAIHFTPSTSSSTILPSSSSSTSLYVTSSPSSIPTANHTVSSGILGQTQAANSAPPAKSSGLSSGAAGGIVAVILILILAVVGFFFCRRARHRRAVKRNTWGAGLVPALENKRGTLYAGQLFANQTMAPSGSAPQRVGNIPPNTSEMSESLQAPSIPGLVAPASSYNPTSPISPIVPKSLRGEPSLRSVAPSTKSGSTGSELALVARTFIPNLPDELNIANGEQIHILTAYDDGWAFCTNSRGEQGVVPLECLQRSTSVPVEMQLQPQSQFGGSEPNRTSKRLSSLMPNAAGTY